jgi:hypothetical protein
MSTGYTPQRIDPVQNAPWWLSQAEPQEGGYTGSQIFNQMNTALPPTQSNFYDAAGNLQQGSRSGSAAGHGLFDIMLGQWLQSRAGDQPLVTVNEEGQYDYSSLMQTLFPHLFQGATPTTRTDFMGGQ